MAEDKTEIGTNIEVTPEKIEAVKVSVGESRERTKPERNVMFDFSLSIIKLVGKGTITAEEGARVIANEAAQLEMFAREASEMAQTDHLTSALNRRGLEVAIGKLGNNNYSLAEVDIDHFKDINDKYGHQAGDEALKQMVAASSAALREPGKLDLIARVGGEEFMFLLPGVKDSVELKKIVERIRSAIATTPVVFNNSEGMQQVLYLKVSAGAVANEIRMDFKSVYKSVDELLYRAKEEGRDRSVVLGVD